MTHEVEIARPFREILNPARYKVFYGGRGSGKSWTIGKVLVSRAAFEKKKILCAREIQKSIKDSVYALLVEQIEQLDLSKLYEITKNSIRGIYSGSEIIFNGLRHNVQEIKSTEGIDICWVEEAQGVSEESWKVLIPTIRKPDSEIWVTFNPAQESDPTYQRFIVNPPPGSIVRKVNWNDNPWFPEVLRAELEYDRRIDPDKYLHIWEGNPVQHSEAQVFYGKWVIEEFETDDTFSHYYGADWGFSVDPSVLVHVAIKDRTLYIEHEAYAVGCDIDKLPELFNRVPNAASNVITADSARPETISYMQQHGFPRMKPSKKWPGCVEDGITHIRGYERILIHPRCRHAIDEFRLYSYRIDRLTGGITNQIEGKHDHVVDSLRYSLIDVMKNSKVIVTDCTGW